MCMQSSRHLKWNYQKYLCTLFWFLFHYSSIILRWHTTVRKNSEIWISSFHIIFNMRKDSNLRGQTVLILQWSQRIRKIRKRKQINLLQFHYNRRSNRRFRLKTFVSFVKLWDTRRSNALIIMRGVILFVLMLI